VSPAAAQRPQADIPWGEAAEKIEKVWLALREVAQQQNAEDLLGPLIAESLFPIEDICDQMAASAEREAFKELIRQVVAAFIRLTDQQKRKKQPKAVAKAARDQSSTGDKASLWQDAYGKTSELRDLLRARSP
jgi:hypothetical protein